MSCFTAYDHLNSLWKCDAYHHKNIFKKFLKNVDFEHLHRLCEQKNIKVVSTIL